MHAIVASKIEAGMMLRKNGQTWIVRGITGAFDGDEFNWTYYVELLPTRAIRPISSDEMQALFLGSEIVK